MNLYHNGAEYFAKNWFSGVPYPNRNHQRRAGGDGFSTFNLL